MYKLRERMNNENNMLTGTIRLLAVVLLFISMIACFSLRNDRAYAEELPEIQNISTDINAVITWDAVEGAARYKIVYKKINYLPTIETEYVDTNRFDYGAVREGIRSVIMSITALDASDQPITKETVYTFENPEVKIGLEIKVIDDEGNPVQGVRFKVGEYYTGYSDADGIARTGFEITLDKDVLFKDEINTLTAVDWPEEYFQPVFRVHPGAKEEPFNLEGSYDIASDVTIIPTISTDEGVLNQWDAIYNGTYVSKIAFRVPYASWRLDFANDLIFIATKKYADVKVNKTDHSSGDPLSDVVFEVVNDSGKTITLQDGTSIANGAVAGTITTDSQGKGSLGGLPNGYKFIIRETANPHTGYGSPNWEKSFETKVTDPREYDVTNMKISYGGIIFDKRDYSHTSYKLAGAEFTVYNRSSSSITLKDGTVIPIDGTVCTITTGSDGTVSTGQILPVLADDGSDAEYQYQETAPPYGYNNRAIGPFDIGVAPGEDNLHVVYNTRNSFAIRINKMVLPDAGNQSPPDSFDFEITLKDSSENPVNGSYHYYYASDRSSNHNRIYSNVEFYRDVVNDNPTIEFVDGKATVSVPRDDILYICDIQKGYQYEIEEKENPDYYIWNTDTDTAGGNFESWNFINALNEEKPEAEGTFDVETRKIAHGFDLKKDQFEFELVDDEGTVVSTAKNDASGNVKFTGIPVDSSDFSPRTVVYSKAKDWQRTAADAWVEVNTRNISQGKYVGYDIYTRPRNIPADAFSNRDSSIKYGEATDSQKIATNYWIKIVNDGQGNSKAYVYIDIAKTIPPKGSTTALFMGTKEYTIREKIPSETPDPSIGYSRNEHKAVVTSGIDYFGNIVSEVQYTDRYYTGSTPRSFENYSAGSLRVSKTVEGDAPEGKEYRFMIKVSGYGRYGDDMISGTYGDMEFNVGIAYITLKAGETKVATEIPVGEYKIEEIKSSDYHNEYEIQSENEVGEIVAGEEATASFVNVYEPRKGSLKVTKTVEGEGADKEKEFEFTVTLEDKEISGEYGEMVFENGVASFKLKDGETKTAEGLPEELNYSVEEADYSSEGYTKTSEGESGAIIPEETVTAAFTNTLKKEETPKDNEEEETPKDDEGEETTPDDDNSSDIKPDDASNTENKPETAETEPDTVEGTDTGDANMFSLYLLLMLASSLAAPALLIARKRQNR